MPHVGFTIDRLGVARTADGECIDLRAGAYDTCVLLGADPVYASDTLLPEKVRAYYEPLGNEVLEFAVKGWMRGRGFTMRDPWTKFVPPDRGRRGPRRVRASKPLTLTLSDGTVVAGESGGVGVTQLSATRSTGSKSEPEMAGYSTAQNVEQVLITPDVVKGLSKDLRKDLREHLERREWEPQASTPGTWECRYVSDVLRTLRLRSTGGLSGPWSVLARDLRAELQWHRPTLSGRRTFTADQL